MRFRQKALLWMIWLLTLSYGIGGVVLIRQSFRQALEEREEAAIASYRMTLQTVELVNSVDAQRNLFNVTAALRRMSTTAGWSALRLISDTRTEYSYGAVFFPLQAGDWVQRIVFSREGEYFLQLSGSLTANDERLQLDIVYPITTVYKTREMQIDTYRRIFLVLFFGGGGLAWLISYFLTRPLYRVSAASRRLAQGELTARAKVRTKDEVGDLAADFNFMAGRLEDNMNELTDAMRRQEQFMGSFAHELKTPMTSIIGYADLLRSGALGEKEAMDAANYIFSEGKRLETLSMKLLELLVAKSTPSAPVKTELSSLLKKLARQLQPVYAKAGIRLQTRCAVCYAMTDPDLFRSLIINLMDNSRKALDHGGIIRITAEASESGSVIRVADNGCGMPEEALAHITEAFYRVDKSRSRRQGGVGLGLTLCSRIAELHGAVLEFASRPSEGTIVTLRMPEVKE